MKLQCISEAFKGGEVGEDGSGINRMTERALSVRGKLQYISEAFKGWQVEGDGMYGHVWKTDLLNISFMSLLA